VSWPTVRRRGSGLDVCSAVHRYYFVLMRGVCEGYFANWVMTQAFWLAALKTDGPITGNYTGSFGIS